MVAGRPASAPLPVTVQRLAAVGFAVLVAASLTALVATQQIRSGPLILDEVEVDHRLRPPKRARILFRLTEDEPRATVEIIDSADSAVATLAEEVFLGDYEIHRFSWRGRGPGGERLPRGHYRVRVRLSSQDRVIVLPGRLKLRRPRVEPPARPRGPSSDDV